MKTSDKLRTASIIIAAIGLVDALYLSAVKLLKTEVYCAGSGNCQTVNSSIYAEFAGIPIAFLGAGAFAVSLAVLLLESRGGFWRENSPLIVFGLTLAGTLYSAYLTYIEIAVLRAICPYCVVSAIAQLLLLVLAIFRVVKDEPEPKYVRRGG
jgi:uncharacterized membrane protein